MGEGEEYLEFGVALNLLLPGDLSAEVNCQRSFFQRSSLRRIAASSFQLSLRNSNLLCLHCCLLNKYWLMMSSRGLPRTTASSIYLCVSNDILHTNTVGEKLYISGIDLCSSVSLKGFLLVAALLVKELLHFSASLPIPHPLCEVGVRSRSRERFHFK